MSRRETANRREAVNRQNAADRREAMNRQEAANRREAMNRQEAANRRRSTAGTPGPRRLRDATGARAVALVLVALLGAGTLAGCGDDQGGGTDGTGSGASRDAGESAGGAGESAGAPRLTVRGAYIPRPITTGMAAGYFTVRNTGGADTLTSVSSDLAAHATLHATSGGTMRERDSFPVPAHGTLTFGRGANHVMFEQLTHRPEVGDKVRVELHFKRSGTLRVTVPVRPATYDPAASGGK